MKKSRFTEAQMVTILREADRRPVPEVAKQPRRERADDLQLAQALRDAGTSRREAFAPARRTSSHESRRPHPRRVQEADGDDPRLVRREPKGRHSPVISGPKKPGRSHRHGARLARASVFTAARVSNAMPAAYHGAAPSLRAVPRPDLTPSPRRRPPGGPVSTPRSSRCCSAPASGRAVCSSGSIEANRASGIPRTPPGFETHLEARDRVRGRRARSRPRRLRQRR